MACENESGVKNLMITFHSCDTNETVGPIAHLLSDENTQPDYKQCPLTKTRLNGKKVRVTRSSAEISVSVMPDDSIDLAWYQGCASIDIQIEYFNGRVVSGRDGSVVDAANGNFEAQQMTIIFDQIDIRKPTLAAAA